MLYDLDLHQGHGVVRNQRLFVIFLSHSDMEIPNFCDSDYIKEMTANKTCKHGTHRSEQYLMLLQLFWL